MRPAAAINLVLRDCRRLPNENGIPELFSRSQTIQRVGAQCDQDYLARLYVFDHHGRCRFIQVSFRSFRRRQRFGYCPSGAKPTHNLKGRSGHSDESRSTAGRRLLGSCTRCRGIGEAGVQFRRIATSNADGRGDSGSCQVDPGCCRATGREAGPARRPARSSRRAKSKAPKPQAQAAEARGRRQQVAAGH